MVSNFRIQASNPQWSRVINEEDEHIGDAMQTVFPMWTEEAYMVWNGIHIPMSYKYTFSFLIQDALMILEALSRETSGALTNHWPSDDFSAMWHMKWDIRNVDIQAEWETVLGGTVALLNARPTVSIEKGAFISEWKQVLGVALRALTEAGYTNDRLSDLARLRRVYESIREPGVLYRESCTTA
jgi:hypothetical protein